MAPENDHSLTPHIYRRLISFWKIKVEVTWGGDCARMAKGLKSRAKREDICKNVEQK